MDKKFKIGDIVYVSGNVQFKDAGGKVVDLGKNADFVVVKLYGVDGGNRSFHSSDLTRETDNEDEDEDEDEIYCAFYDEEEHTGWVGKIRKFEVDGRTKWREEQLDGEDVAPDWGHATYMSYLSPADLMSWLEKDYGRHYDVRGPFDSRAEAREYMKKKFMLDESTRAGAAKFKVGDYVHMGFAVRNGSGVRGTLEKIEGGYAFVRVKKGSREDIVKGFAAYLSKEINESATFIKTADWKDGGLTYRRWDFDHADGSKTVGTDLVDSLKETRAQRPAAALEESEFLQRMLKHVSDKRDLRNTDTATDNAAIADAKKASAGKKKFAGINYKNDAPLMKDLLSLGRTTSRKEAALAVKSNLPNVETGKNFGPVKGTKTFADYISTGKSVRGGQIVNKSSPAGYFDDGE